MTSSWSTIFRAAIAITSRRSCLHVVPLQDTAAFARLLQGVDAVVHFAAVHRGRRIHPRARVVFLEQRRRIAVAVRGDGAARVRRLVFSSTAAVYGNPAKVPIPEDAPFAPVSPYGESKATVERILRQLDLCRGLRSIALRYFNACGAEPAAGLGEEHEPETHLIPLLFRASRPASRCRFSATIIRPPDGTCIRDYIHVERSGAGARRGAGSSAGRRRFGRVQRRDRDRAIR